MDERLRRRYLEAMGIVPWVPRVESGAAGSASGPVRDGSGVRAGVREPMALAATLDDVSRPSGPPAAHALPVAELGWDQLRARVSACRACELAETRTQTVFGVGNQDAGLMVIGEAPGADEDRQGEPFVGRAGQLLNAMLRAIGLDRQQVFIANIVKCRPPGNRDPRPEEARRCRPFLLRQIELVGPRAILSVGLVSARNLLDTDAPLGRLRGRSHRFQGIPLIVTYHPAYLLRSPEQKVRAWQDLLLAAKILRAR